MGEGEGSYVWSSSDQDLGAPKKSLKKGGTKRQKRKSSIKRSVSLFRAAVCSLEVAWHHLLSTQRAGGSRRGLLPSNWSKIVG
jgi:hypothetical protein